MCIRYYVPFRQTPNVEFPTTARLVVFVLPVVFNVFFFLLRFSCFFLSLQENDLNDMLNSLYDLPVPKPYTPINLSVVGTDRGLAWGGWGGGSGWTDCQEKEDG